MNMMVRRVLGGGASAGMGVQFVMSGYQDEIWALGVSVSKDQKKGLGVLT